MTKSELIDRIGTWLMLQSVNTPIPPRPTPLGEVARQVTEHDWLRGSLANVIALDDAPAEIKRSPTGTTLAEAVALARQGRAETLPVIVEKLTSVLRDLQSTGRA